MDPATMAAVLRAAADAKKAIDTAALRGTVEHIRNAVDFIGVQLAEDVLVEVRSGFDHLAVAVETSDDELRRDELGHSRQYFTRLANRSGGGVVAGTSGSLSGDQVCALGYLGKYHYFLVRGEPHLALIAAYMCTERFPALGAQLFPPRLFSRNYGELVRSSDAHQEWLILQNQMKHEERRNYGMEMAWRVPAAGRRAARGTHRRHRQPSPRRSGRDVGHGPHRGGPARRASAAPPRRWSAATARGRGGTPPRSLEIGRSRAPPRA
jgi:hypothetical protein